MARPAGIALTPDQQLRIVESLEAGNSYEVAGESGGSSKRSMERYTTRGRAADATLTELLKQADDDTIAALEQLEGDDLTNALVALLPEAERSYWRFWRACARARAMAEQRAVTLIREAGLGWKEETVTVVEEDRVVGGKVQRLTKRTVMTRTIRDWKAEAWWLERARQADWTRREGLELTGAGGGPVQVEGLEAKRERALALVTDQVAVRREQRARAEALARGEDPDAEPGPDVEVAADGG